MVCSPKLWTISSISSSTTINRRLFSTLRNISNACTVRCGFSQNRTAPPATTSSLINIVTVTVLPEPAGPQSKIPRLYNIPSLLNAACDSQNFLMPAIISSDAVSFKSMILSVNTGVILKCITPRSSTLTLYIPAGKVFTVSPLAAKLSLPSTIHCFTLTLVCATQGAPSLSLDSSPSSAFDRISSSSSCSVILTYYHI